MDEILREILRGGQVYYLHNDVASIENTAEKRKSKDTIDNWEEQVRGIEISDYQKELWIRYQRQFKYAKDISFDNSVQVIREIMQQIF